MSWWSELWILPTWPAALFGVASILAVIVLAVVAMRRGGGQRGTRWLEVVRVLLVIAFVLTLLQPERRHEVLPQARPRVEVRWDDSPSMATADLLDTELGLRPSPQDAAAPAGDATGRPISRREALASVLEARPFAPLEERFDVVLESFSSAEAEGTDLDAALRSALEVGEELRAVVLFSDGDWNEGAPPSEAAMRARARGVPVFCVPIGREVPLPNLEVAALDPPTFSVIGRPLQVPFALRSTLPKDTDVIVHLEVSDGTKQMRSLRVPAFGEVREVFPWKPGVLGTETLQVFVEPVEGDVLPGDDRREVEVAVRAEALKVLVVESAPRWEYRYLRNALERDPGVEVSCLLFHPGLTKTGGGPGYRDSFPAGPEELGRYDVIFLGDVGVRPGELTAEQCAQILGVVQEQAAGLVLIPGRRGAQVDLLDTALAELYPVQLDTAYPHGFGASMPSRFVLTEAGRKSLLTRLADDPGENQVLWRSLPGCNWRSPADRSRPGSEVLAVHETSRAPLIVTRSFGTGKVLFMGTDAAWRWREGVEDKYHYRFWGQVARWMAYQRHMAAGEMLRFFYTPERPGPRSTMSLFANVLDPTGAPLGKATLTAEVRGPSGRVEHIGMKVSNAEWGLYSASYTPTQSGEHRVLLRCEETGAVLETQWTVQGGAQERIGRPARPEVLKEIASIARGRSVSPDRVAELVQELAALPEPQPEVRRTRLWAHPVWAAVLTTLLTIFWIGRKLQGAY